MLRSAIVGAIALCGAASAAAVVVPAAALITAAPVAPAAYLERRDPAKATDPWVSVNDVPEAVTLTPVWTTDSQGKSSLKDAAPSSLTGSVFSFTTLGEPTTTTGDPPNPTPTGKNGAGAFSRCYNMDGEWKPFCRPTYNSTLEPGNTYYITWDPDYYNDTKTNISYSLTVRLEYVNTTSNEWTYLADYPDRKTPGTQGYFPLDVTNDLLAGRDVNNITITLLQRVNGTDGTPEKSVAFPVTIAKFKYPASAHSSITGHTLTIALPVVFGTILLLVVGLCIWNRKTRRIELGNIVPRSRKGYSGRSERSRRMFGGSAGATDADFDHDIQLGGGGFPEEGPQYRDAPSNNNNHNVNSPRRDSDGLDSLAASPVHENFQQQGTTGGRNAFRDEIDRQHNERHGAF